MLVTGGPDVNDDVKIRRCVWHWIVGLRSHLPMDQWPCRRRSVAGNEAAGGGAELAAGFVEADGGGGLVVSQGDDVVVKFAASKSVRENYA